MPRPRVNPDAILVRELRITPPNEHLDVSTVDDDPTILKFVAYMEGGDGVRTHYHCLITTTMTQGQLAKWIYKVAGAVDTEFRGNSVFFSRQPHQMTEQYICKKNDLYHSKGYEPTMLDEWVKRSNDYQEAIRVAQKNRKMKRGAELLLVEESIENDLKDTLPSSITAGFLIDLVIARCRAHMFRFPTRPQMDAMVLRLIYPYDKSTVLDFYKKSFPVPFVYN